MKTVYIILDSDGFDICGQYLEYRDAVHVCKEIKGCTMHSHEKEIFDNNLDYSYNF